MTTNQIEILAIVSVLVNVALLCFVVWYNRRLQKEVQVDIAKTEKAPVVDDREMFDVYRDIVCGTACGYESFFYFLAAVHSRGSANIEDFRKFAFIGIPIFEWYAKEFGCPISEAKNIPPVPIVSIENVFRRFTGPGEIFYNLRLDPNPFVHTHEAEFLSTHEDFLISTGILPVPGKTDERKNGSVKS